MSGNLFIISGPSGAGKSSLCKALLDACINLNLSISCTTRAPRSGEKDGREYHFLNPQIFAQQKNDGAFLESALVHGHYYGTRQHDVEVLLQQNKDVLLEIDWQGAAQVAAKLPAIRIFILPPSIEALRERLTERGQDDEAVIQQRVAAAQAEIEHAKEARYQIVNDDFNTALEQLIQLVNS